ncbi:hypothetical protein BD324DRAFT_611289 [Kockovaella imperatae]|uniref:Uncharacterized protein n=1 Tax=Kockovaella imperatae TaxID=4999 RepID=A0A1Y1UR68_9TREE|nr:hypothetical protein BD324DRAFT_611289 [Kockovaella imperatae]ORX40563.1 hypothetical protein BD324DRAFT_611289 [Kockovaella imperatae]
MSSLLSQTVQPPILTLLSSTSIPPISPLFTQQSDPSSSKSIITVIHDDEEIGRQSYIRPRNPTKGALKHRVVHIQSPNLTDTYTQMGSDPPTGHTQGPESRSGKPIGATHPWICLQLRRLGRRHFSLEVGLVDSRGKHGIVRCSSFQTTPTLHPDRHTPLIHLPIAIPPKTASQLTPWLDIALNLNTLISLFGILKPPSKATEDSTPAERPSKRLKEDSSHLPDGSLGSITYIRVYANCRLRKIWLSEHGQKTLNELGQAGHYDFGLFAARSSMT